MEDMEEVEVLEGYEDIVKTIYKNDNTDVANMPNCSWLEALFPMPENLRPTLLEEGGSDAFMQSAIPDLDYNVDGQNFAFSDITKDQGVSDFNIFEHLNSMDNIRKDDEIKEFDIFQEFDQSFLSPEKTKADSQKLKSSGLAMESYSESSAADVVNAIPDGPSVKSDSGLEKFLDKIIDPIVKNQFKDTSNKSNSEISIKPNETVRYNDTHRGAITEISPLPFRIESESNIDFGDSFMEINSLNEKVTLKTSGISTKTPRPTGARKLSNKNNGSKRNEIFIFDGITDGNNAPVEEDISLATLQKDFNILLNEDAAEHDTILSDNNAIPPQSSIRNSPRIRQYLKRRRVHQKVEKQRSTPNNRQENTTKTSQFDEKYLTSFNITKELKIILDKLEVDRYLEKKFSNEKFNSSENNRKASDINFESYIDKFNMSNIDFENDFGFDLEYMQEKGKIAYVKKRRRSFDKELLHKKRYSIFDPKTSSTPDIKNGKFRIEKRKLLNVENENWEERISNNKTLPRSDRATETNRQEKINCGEIDKSKIGHRTQYEMSYISFLNNENTDEIFHKVNRVKNKVPRPTTSDLSTSKLRTKSVPINEEGQNFNRSEIRGESSIDMNIFNEISKIPQVTERTEYDSISLVPKSVQVTEGSGVEIINNNVRLGNIVEIAGPEVNFTGNMTEDDLRLTMATITGEDVNDILKTLEGSTNLLTNDNNSTTTKALAGGFGHNNSQPIHIAQITGTQNQFLISNSVAHNKNSLSNDLRGITHFIILPDEMVNEVDGTLALVDGNTNVPIISAAALSNSVTIDKNQATLHQTLEMDNHLEGGYTNSTQNSLEMAKQLISSDPLCISISNQMDSILGQDDSADMIIPARLTNTSIDQNYDVVSELLGSTVPTQNSNTNQASSTTKKFANCQLMKKFLNDSPVDTEIGGTRLIKLKKRPNKRYSGQGENEIEPVKNKIDDKFIERIFDKCEQLLEQKIERLFMRYNIQPEHSVDDETRQKRLEFFKNRRQHVIHVHKFLEEYLSPQFDDQWQKQANSPKANQLKNRKENIQIIENTLIVSINSKSAEEPTCHTTPSNNCTPNRNNDNFKNKENNYSAEQDSSPIESDSLPEKSINLRLNSMTSKNNLDNTITNHDGKSRTLSPKKTSSQHITTTLTKTTATITTTAVAEFEKTSTNTTATSKRPRMSIRGVGLTATTVETTPNKPNLEKNIITTKRPNVKLVEVVAESECGSIPETKARAVETIITNTCRMSDAIKTTAVGVTTKSLTEAKANPSPTPPSAVAVQTDIVSLDESHAQNMDSELDSNKMIAITKSKAPVSVDENRSNTDPTDALPVAVEHEMKEISTPMEVVTEDAVDPDALSIENDPVSIENESLVVVSKNDSITEETQNAAVLDAENQKEHKETDITLVKSILANTEIDVKSVASIEENSILTKNSKITKGNSASIEAISAQEPSFVETKIDSKSTPLARKKRGRKIIWKNRQSKFTSKKKISKPSDETKATQAEKIISSETEKDTTLKATSSEKISARINSSRSESEENLTDKNKDKGLDSTNKFDSNLSVQNVVAVSSTEKGDLLSDTIAKDSVSLQIEKDSVSAETEQNSATEKTIKSADSIEENSILTKNSTITKAIFTTTEDNIPSQEQRFVDAEIDSKSTPLARKKRGRKIISKYKQSNFTSKNKISAPSETTALQAEKIISSETEKDTTLKSTSSEKISAGINSSRSEIEENLTAEKRDKDLDSTNKFDSNLSVQNVVAVSSTEKGDLLSDTIVKDSVSLQIEKDSVTAETEQNLATEKTIKSADSIEEYLILTKNSTITKAIFTTTEDNIPSQEQRFVDAEIDLKSTPLARKKRGRKIISKYKQSNFTSKKKISKPSDETKAIQAEKIVSSETEKDPTLKATSSEKISAGINSSRSESEENLTPEKKDKDVDSTNKFDSNLSVQNVVAVSSTEKRHLISDTIAKDSASLEVEKYLVEAETEQDSATRETIKSVDSIDENSILTKNSTITKAIFTTTENNIPSQEPSFVDAEIDSKSTSLPRKKRGRKIISKYKQSNFTSKKKDSELSETTALQAEKLVSSDKTLKTTSSEKISAGINSSRSESEENLTAKEKNLDSTNKFDSNLSVQNVVAVSSTEKGDLISDTIAKNSVSLEIEKDSVIAETEQDSSMEKIKNLRKARKIILSLKKIESIATDIETGSKTVKTEKQLIPIQTEPVVMPETTSNVKRQKSLAPEKKTDSSFSTIRKDRKFAETENVLVETEKNVAVSSGQTVPYSTRARDLTNATKQNDSISSAVIKYSAAVEKENYSKESTIPANTSLTADIKKKVSKPALKSDNLSITEDDKDSELRKKKKESPQVETIKDVTDTTSTMKINSTITGTEEDTLTNARTVNALQTESTKPPTPAMLSKDSKVEQDRRRKLPPQMILTRKRKLKLPSEELASKLKRCGTEVGKSRIEMTEKMSILKKVKVVVQNLKIDWDLNSIPSFRVTVDKDGNLSKCLKIDILSKAAVLNTTTTKLSSVMTSTTPPTTTTTTTTTTAPTTKMAPITTTVPTTRTTTTTALTGVPTMASKITSLQTPPTKLKKETITTRKTAALVASSALLVDAKSNNKQLTATKQAEIVTFTTAVVTAITTTTATITKPSMIKRASNSPIISVKSLKLNRGSAGTSGFAMRSKRSKTVGSLYGPAARENQIPAHTIEADRSSVPYKKIGGEGDQLTKIIVSTRDKDVPNNEDDQVISATVDLGLNNKEIVNLRKKNVPLAAGSPSSRTATKPDAEIRDAPKDADGNQIRETTSPIRNKLDVRKEMEQSTLTDNNSKVQNSLIYNSEKPAIFKLREAKRLRGAFGMNVDGIISYNEHEHDTKQPNPNLLSTNPIISQKIPKAEKTDLQSEVHKLLSITAIDEEELLQTIKNSPPHDEYNQLTDKIFESLVSSIIPEISQMQNPNIVDTPSTIQQTSIKQVTQQRSSPKKLNRDAALQSNALPRRVAKKTAPESKSQYFPPLCDYSTQSPSNRVLNLPLSVAQKEAILNSIPQRSNEQSKTKLPPPPSGTAKCEHSYGIKYDSQHGKPLCIKCGKYVIIKFGNDPNTTNTTNTTTSNTTTHSRRKIATTNTITSTTATTSVKKHFENEPEQSLTPPMNDVEMTIVKEEDEFINIPYIEDYSLDTGYQFKCYKCPIVLTTRYLIRQHIKSEHPDLLM